MKNKSKQKLKIMFTGGHLTPAMAVLREMERQGYQHFIWVGTKYRNGKQLTPEYKTVTQHTNAKFINLRTGKLIRSWKHSSFFLFLKHLLLIPWGFIGALITHLRWQPDVIISFGGYLALPIAIIGKLLGKKVVTHEQTVTIGLANKIIAKFADLVLVAWKSSLKHYPTDKTIFTGNPIRQAILESKSNSFNFNNSLPIIYVTCGNQGSAKINAALLPIIPQLLENTNIIHQTGTSSIEQAQQLQKELPEKQQQRYICRDYIFEDEVGEAFHKADFVIMRAGANTITDILALGKPSLMIPIPWVSHNEQLLNAQKVAAVGLGSILEEKNLSSESLLQRVQTMLGYIETNTAFDNTNSLENAKAEGRNLVNLEATSHIVQEVEQLIT